MAGDFSNVVIKNGDEQIGDVVFLDRQWVLVRAFFDDRDANEDGTVSIGEKIAWKVAPLNISGFQLARVAYAATFNMDVARRDPAYMEFGRKMQIAFAADLVVRGFQSVYLKGHAGKIAGMFVNGYVAQWMVKKGAEKLVAEAVTLMRQS